MIHVMDRADRLAAKNAVLSFIPFGDDVPDQAGLRVTLDLLQALLTTILALWPARTLIEAYRGLVEESSESSFARRYVDSLWLMGFRTGDQALSAKREEGSHSGNGAENEESNRQNKNRNGDGENRDCHR